MICKRGILGDWSSIWNWKGPHKIQTFMWLAVHGRLLTNYRRSRWGWGFHRFVDGETPILIRCIQDLISRNWQTQFTHTRRERNRSADWLANHSFTHNSFDVVMLETSPRELQSILFDNISGVCMPRIVRIAP
jgi:hypothetical protein